MTDDPLGLLSEQKIDDPLGLLGDTPGRLPEPSSNPFVNLGKGLYKGTVYGIPEQLGKAAQFLGVGGQTAKDIAKWGEEGIGKEEKGVFQQTGEMIPESIGVPIVSHVLGSALQAIPHPAAKLAGLAIKIGGRYITPALFGLAQAQSTRETAEKAGVPEGITPYVTGGIEWAGETAANIALGRALGPLAAMGKAGKAAIAKMSVTGALKGTIGTYLKELALVTAPTEILTEMGQNYGEALAEKMAGIRPEAEPGQEAISAIAPTALMTAILGPFGRIAQHHVINKQASILSEPVDTQDPDFVDRVTMRLKVAKAMNNVIPEENKDLRNQWTRYAQQKIYRNESIDINAPLDTLSMSIDLMMAEDKEGSEAIKVEMPPAKIPVVSAPAEERRYPGGAERAHPDQTDWANMPDAALARMASDQEPGREKWVQYAAAEIERRKTAASPAPVQEERRHPDIPSREPYTEKRMALERERTQAEEKTTPVAEGFSKVGYTSLANAHQWIKENGKNPSDYDIYQENGRWMVTDKEVAPGGVEAAIPAAGVAPAAAKVAPPAEEIGQPGVTPGGKQTILDSKRLTHIVKIDGMENQAIVTRNTIPGESPWRITWFNENGEVVSHIPMDTPESFPTSFINGFGERMKIDVQPKSPSVLKSPEAAKVEAASATTPAPAEAPSPAKLAFIAKEKATHGPGPDATPEQIAKFDAVTEARWKVREARGATRKPKAPRPKKPPAPPAHHALLDETNPLRAALDMIRKDGLRTHEGTATDSRSAKGGKNKQVIGNKSWVGTDALRTNLRENYGMGLDGGIRESGKLDFDTLSDDLHRMGIGWNGTGDDLFNALSELPQKGDKNYGISLLSQEIERNAGLQADAVEQGRVNAINAALERDDLTNAQIAAILRDQGLSDEEITAALQGVDDQATGEKVDEFLAQKPTKKDFIGKEETAPLPGIPTPPAPGFSLTPAKGETAAPDELISYGPPTKSMFGFLHPSDWWQGMGKYLANDVRQIWKSKLEEFQNERRTVTGKDRTTSALVYSANGRENEISLRRGLRDRRLFDAQVESGIGEPGEGKWTEVKYSLHFSKTAEFQLADRYFTGLGYQVVPITRASWGAAVNLDTKTVFLGKMSGDRFAYFMTHEIAHILMAQGNMAALAVKKSIDVDNAILQNVRENFGWSNDYLQDEIAAAVIGGQTDYTPVIMGDQAANIREARNTIGDMLNQKEMAEVPKSMDDPIVSKYVKDVYHTTFNNLKPFQQKDVRDHFSFEEQLKNRIRTPSEKLEDALDGIESRIEREQNKDVPNDSVIESLEKKRDQIQERIDAREEMAISGPLVSPAQDAAYLKAVESGDMDTAQKMVDEAAKRAGYNVGPVWHGSVETGLTTINPDFAVEVSGVSLFSDNEDVSHIFRFEREYGEVKTSYYDEATDEEIEIEPGDLIKGYLKLNNPLILEDSEAQEATDDTALQQRVVKQAIKDGHDGIIFKDVSEGVGDWTEEGTTYGIFNGNQIKSADPVTRDDKGNVIPLSERFNETTPDIRYMAEPGPLGTEPTRNPQEQALYSATLSMRANEPSTGYTLEAIATAYETATGNPFPYRELFPAFSKLGTTVSFKASRIKNKNGAAAVYDEHDNQIIVNDSTLKFSPDPIGKYEEIFSHEMIHAILTKNLKQTNMPVYIELQARINGFYRELIPHIDQADYRTQSMFELIGAQNATSEILNLAFTNPGFAKWLDSIPSTRKVDGKSTTLWGRLKDIILKAINRVARLGQTKLDELNGIMDSFLGDIRIEKQPIWTSKVIPLIEKKMRMKMSVAQLRAMLQKDVTQAEMDMLFAGLSGQVTKQEVLDAVKMNTVEFKDVMLGGGRTLAERTKDVEDAKELYDNADDAARTALSESGRNNADIRDLFAVWRRDKLSASSLESALDKIGRKDLFTNLIATEKAYFQKYKDIKTEYAETAKFDSVTSKGVEGGIPGTYRELTVTMPGRETGTELNKYIYVDPRTGELSRSPGAIRKDNPNYSNPTTQWRDQHSQYSDIANPVIRIHFDERNVDGQRILFIREIQSISKTKPPSMPQWAWDKAYEIGVKRILAYAKENGYDGVSWSPGKIVADRYNLAKQLDNVQVTKFGTTGNYDVFGYNKGDQIVTYRDISGDKLSDVVGKELAGKIDADLGQTRSGSKDYSGLDLEIGGEGIKDVYDRRLPGLFKKYGKEGVGEVKIDTGNDLLATQTYTGPVLTINEISKKARTLGATLESQAKEVIKSMGVDDETFEQAMGHQSEALAMAFGGKLSELPRKSIAASFIPITPNTPGSFSQFSLPALPPALKRTLGTLTSTFTSNPQNFPKSLNDTLKKNSQGLRAGELKGLDYAFSLPFHMSQKYHQWKEAWRIHGIMRPEMRADLRTEHVKYAEPYFDIDNRLKKDGLNRTQRKEAKARVVRMVFATDATLHERMKALIEQALVAPTKAEAQAIQAKIDDIRFLRRYSDAELRAGIVDEYENTIKLNSPTEIAAYTAVRHSMDKMMDAKIDWLHTMAFRKWKDQKWYNLILQASGMDLTKEDAQTLIGKKGLNAAALAAAKKIQVSLKSIFTSIEDNITEAPADELVAVAGKYDKLYTRVAENLLQFQKYLGEVTNITDKGQLSELTKQVFAAYVQTRPYLKQISTLRNQWGNLVGYAPRTRDQGKFKIRLVEMMPDDETGIPTERPIYSEMFNNLREYRQLYADLLAKHGDKEGNLPENWFIDAKTVTVSPEMAFQGVNDMNTQKIIDDAITNMKRKGPFSDDVYEQLQQDAYQAIANQFMTRGAGKAGIHRTPGEAIKGYDEQNLDRVLLGYISSMTGLMTKQLAAADFIDLLKGEKDASMFAGLSKYNREMLRNDSYGDKLSGTLRSVAFVWFLGGLMKSAAVNLTQNPIVGFAELHKYMKERVGEIETENMENNRGAYAGLGRKEKLALLEKRIKKNSIKGLGDVEYAKALKDVLLWKQITMEEINKGLETATGKEREQLLERKFEAQMISKGIAQDQYIQSIFEGMHGKVGGTLLATARFLAIPFSKSEVYNRTSAGIALFRQAYPMYLKQGLSEENAYDATFADARTFIDNVHYAYGKPNRPLWMQSGDFSSKVLHTAYTFRGFTHNFLIRQATLLSQGDWQTFLHTMAYIAVLGGLMGLPFFKDFFDWVEKEFGFSPTNYVRRTLRGIGGKTLEEFGISGLPSVLGANISGSLAVGLPYPIGSRTPEDTIFGVWSGVAQKGQRAMEAVGRGNYARAAQELAPEALRSPSVALRESAVGKEMGYPGFATTPRGQAMMDETGKPISIKGHEAALRAVGFNPTSYAREKEKIATATRQEAWAADQKTHIVETLRVAKLNGDPDAMKDMMKSVRELNQKIRSRGLEKLVPLASIQKVIQSSRQVRGMKERREMRYKQAEL